MTYRYGAYGFLNESIVKASATSGTVPVYVGVAPVNLVRGYAAANVVNNPVKIINYTNAQSLLGYSADWKRHTLCEAMEAHFNNTIGNIGPVYMINVLDPDIHRTTSTFTHTVSLTFADGKAKLNDGGMIDTSTLALDSLVLDTDYSLEKSNGQIIITDKKSTLTTVQASFTATGKLAALTTTNGRVDFLSDAIILDTVSVFDTDGKALVEDVDYSLNYNFTTGAVIISGANLPKNINVTYAEVDASKITAADIVGAAVDGTYTGIQALKYLYQNHNVVVSYIVAPGYSHLDEVYKAMVTIMTNLNGHWNNMVFMDLPTVDEDADAPQTIAAAKAWKKEHDFTSERAINPFWPKAINAQGQVFHGSVLAAVEQQRIDATHDDVPFETFANKTIPVTGMYFGKNSKAKAFDQELANELTAAGIGTYTYWGGNWVLWGDHTAAYEYGKDIDPRAIFGVSMRMLYYVLNKFQLKWGPVVDKPMDVKLKDRILNEEQESLDALQAVGALLGEPEVVFLESENSTEELMQGQFMFNFNTTPTPPAKALMAGIAYTDAGFSAYFSE